MGEAMKDYLAVSGLGPKLRDWPVLDAWRKVLGEPLCRRARPMAFHAGRLVVEVESSAHLQELRNFTGEQYRLQANRALIDQGWGREAIRQVAFKLKQ